MRSQVIFGHVPDTFFVVTSPSGLSNVFGIFIGGRSSGPRRLLHASSSGGTLYRLSHVATY